MTRQPRSRCGLCCALPIIGIIGSASLISAIAVYVEQIALALLIVSITALRSPTMKRENRQLVKSTSMTKTIIILMVGILAITTTKAQQNTKAMKELTERAKLTCKLTTPELQERKRTVIAELKMLVKERKEETNAFRYKFESTDKNIDLVSSFIKTERLCCDFFTFDLSVESDSEFMWLKLSGPEGVTEFIAEEIGF
jgi:23S rRNA pseudoU1915 N3-methylase RlmH